MPSAVQAPLTTRSKVRMSPWGSEPPWQVQTWLLQVICAAAGSTKNSERTSAKRKPRIPETCLPIESLPEGATRNQRCGPRIVAQRHVAGLLRVSGNALGAGERHVIRHTNTRSENGLQDCPTLALIVSASFGRISGNKSNENRLQWLAESIPLRWRSGPRSCFVINLQMLSDTSRRGQARSPGFACVAICNFRQVSAGVGNVDKKWSWWPPCKIAL